MGEKTEYIKIDSNGPNALDFHIAFYIGQLAAQDPGTYFHIVSKDTDFDPLVQHLKGKRIPAYRTKDVRDIPSVKAIDSKPLSEKLVIIIDYLQRRGAAKSRVTNALSNTINSLFRKQILESGLASLLKELQKQGTIKINGTKISYALP
jgi:hypothetical protein